MHGTVGLVREAGPATPALPPSSWHARSIGTWGGILRMLDSTMDAFLEKRKKRAEQRHEEEQHRDVAAAEAAKSDSERRKEAEEKLSGRSCLGSRNRGQPRTPKESRSRTRRRQDMR